MTVTIINPNATVSMTAAMLDAARRAVPGGGFIGVTSHQGPPSIQGVEDGERATAPLLELVRAASDNGAGAIIIGCFDDTALAAARSAARCPVIGIGQAGYHAAAMAGARFSVVTTLAVSIPILEGNITTYGLRGACARVRASGVPVLALENDPDAAAERVLDEMARAEAEDCINALVLGCAGMVDIPRRARGRIMAPIIDGVAAAATVASFLSRSKA
ncbi:aspartate/glutamate racemase family protein [Puniceibacterium sp. IMCC21224]|uniref:aspartate/glutamate racemase family protein n=1 Tax=Puniceibacterium sp. IMCC21224 TaxID=1618204 RepID=UPI00064E0A18|nr:aspartate/glutamate racemase family protein [Puniceibacterium sp. IMCC21224]KMK65715.1 hydantoin racemase [Puniceibacterium sp. IMCC21224]